jgi:hypothetical protein
VKKRTEDSIYASIIFGVVCDLRVFSENDFATRSDHTELGNINFDDSTLCHHAELGIHWRLGVLFDTKDLQLERRL